METFSSNWFNQEKVDLIKRKSSSCLSFPLPLDFLYLSVLQNFNVIFCSENNFVFLYVLHPFCLLPSCIWILIFHRWLKKSINLSSFLWKTSLPLHILYSEVCGTKLILVTEHKKDGAMFCCVSQERIPKMFLSKFRSLANSEVQLHIKSLLRRVADTFTGLLSEGDHERKTYSNKLFICVNLWGWHYLRHGFIKQQRDTDCCNIRCRGISRRTVYAL